MGGLCKANGVLHICGFKHGIAGSFQQSTGKFAKGSFVFHEKDRLISARKLGPPAWSARSLGKVNFESRAAARFAVGHDIAATLFDDSIYGRKS